MAKVKTSKVEGVKTTKKGRGVTDAGVPMGEQLDAEDRDLNAEYYFQPEAKRRLKRATKKALGR